MSEILKFIPFDDIDKIKIYINSSKLTLKQIVEKENPDYAITGVFYTSSWKPTCHLKKDGEVLANDPYTYWGYSWNNVEDFAMRVIPDKTKLNYICCRSLIENGKKLKDEELRYNSDVGGKRGRTGIGTVDGNLVLYASTDGSINAKTPEDLRDYVYNKGVTESFIMMDGGGKVNYYGERQYFQGRQKSQNLLLIYLKKETENDKEEEQGDETMNIIESFLTKNPRYYSPTYKTKTGYMQHSTGTPGAKASAFISNWNKQSCKAEVELIIDDTGIYQCFPFGAGKSVKTWHCGGSGNNTHVACEVCEPKDTRFLDANWYNLSQNGKNNTTFAVKALQQELVDRGYNTNGVDGIFGAGTKSAVMAFQKDQGLAQDGIVGKDTLHKLQNRECSHVKYNPEENQDYFENVYNKAVYLCAYVLKSLGVSTVTTTNVLSHAEGYKKGIASNHADVGHWWPEHGKSMNDFREDVKEYMSSGKLPFDLESEDLKPSGSTDEMDVAWDKACNKGIFDGSNPDNPCTRKQVATVLDRLGLLD